MTPNPTTPISHVSIMQLHRLQLIILGAHLLIRQRPIPIQQVRLPHLLALGPEAEVRDDGVRVDQQR